MNAPVATMSLKQACEALGVDLRASDGELRRAFREAAKRAHPDRTGGEAEAFRQVVAAYDRLRRKPADRLAQLPALATARVEVLDVPVELALRGGRIERTTPDGRTLRLRLPRGVRTGDRVRAGRIAFETAIRGAEGLAVRGDDIWMNLPVEGRLLAQGGRVEVSTPAGRRAVWITREAIARGVVRLAGQGLPARGAHPQGHLFLRLIPAIDADTPATALRRRFAAAWAA